MGMTSRVPSVLNPRDLHHLNSVVCAIQNTQAVDDGVRKPAEATLAACEESQVILRVCIEIHFIAELH